MLDLRVLIYLITIVIISLFIAVQKPQMHKQAMITSSEYEFAEITIPSSEVQVAQTPVSVQTPPIQTQNTKVSNQKGVNVDLNNKTNNVKTSTPQKKQTVKQQPQQQQKRMAKPASTTSPKPSNTTSQTQPKQQTQAQLPQPKQVKVSQENPIENKPKHILTEQEEIIEWNRWHSRLQNQVMKDTKIAAPLGTQFKFSFTVDKYGSMSNVKVWSTNPAYNQLAINAIKPVLMSYRNKPILDFPEGTKRIIVNASGGFVVSTHTEYSKPSDYHDYEKVKR